MLFRSLQGHERSHRRGHALRAPLGSLHAERLGWCRPFVGNSLNVTPTAAIYNGDGLRMSQTTGGVTTSYIWDVAAGIPLLLQETASGATTTNVFGRGLHYRVDSNRVVTYHVGDALGSSATLTDAERARHRHLRLRCLWRPTLTYRRNND